MKNKTRSRAPRNVSTTAELARRTMAVGEAALGHANESGDGRLLEAANVVCKLAFMVERLGPEALDAAMRELSQVASSHIVGARAPRTLPDNVICLAEVLSARLGRRDA